MDKVKSKIKSKIPPNLPVSKGGAFAPSLEKARHIFLVGMILLVTFSAKFPMEKFN
jgi:hypothetical protein